MKKGLDDLKRRRQDHEKGVQDRDQHFCALGDFFIKAPTDEIEQILTRSEFGVFIPVSPWMKY